MIAAGRPLLIACPARPLEPVVPTANPIGLRQWIWRAFVRSALIPLVLVETALIAIYLLTNNAIRDAQIEYLRDTALNDLQAAVSLESRTVSEQLSQIGALTQVYRNLTAQALHSGEPAALPELALSADGVRYSPENNGGAAVFYRSDARRAPRSGEDRAAATARAADEGDRGAQSADRQPLLQQLGQLQPYLPVVLHPRPVPGGYGYPRTTSITSPMPSTTRSAGWSGPMLYLDPAGHGWMMSAIAPVYRDDFLEGVVGIDITVSGILEQIGQLQVPWGGYAMLVSDDLTIMACRNRKRISARPS